MGVVKPLDVVEGRESGGIARRETLSREQFAFEGGEEGLRHRVVETIAPTAHRCDQAGVSQPSAEGKARVLAPLIGVMNHLAQRPSSPESHLDGFDHQLSTDLPRGHPSAIAQPMIRRLYTSSTTAR